MELESATWDDFPHVADVRKHSIMTASCNVSVDRETGTSEKFEKMLSTFSKVIQRAAPRSLCQARFSSGIKLLNERAKAEEDYYFTKQDGMIVRYAYINTFQKNLSST